MSPQETIKLGVLNTSKVATLIKVGSVTYGLTDAKLRVFIVPLLTKITIEVLSNSVLITVAEGVFDDSQKEISSKHIELLLYADVGSPGDGFIKTVTEAMDIAVLLKPLGEYPSSLLQGAKNSLVIQEVRCGD